MKDVIDEMERNERAFYDKPEYFEEHFSRENKYNPFTGEMKYRLKKKGEPEE